MENKGPLLTFHYRDTPVEFRPASIEKAKELISEFGFTPTEAHCAIEAKPPVEWNKGDYNELIYFISISMIIISIIGRASIYILRTAFGVDWSERMKIIYAGDDETDEDAMMVCSLLYIIHFEHSVINTINFINRHLRVWQPPSVSLNQTL